MQFPLIVSKLVGLLLALLIPVINIIPMPFTTPVDPQVYNVMEKTGGFMRGVCHTEPEYEKIKAANLDWLREDIPYPFNDDGSLSIYYKSWKKEMKDYVKNGIRVLAVTPYPHTFIEHGLDIRREEDVQKIIDVDLFMLKDLRGIVDAYQVTNEMGVDRFTDPLTMKEAAYFIGVQMKAMKQNLKGNEIIGYNLGGLGYLTLSFKMLKYNKYADYIGVDLYLGSFENIVKNIDTHFAIMRLVRAITQKPILMAEFGYMGYGEPKTAAEKKAILQSYGFDSEDAVRKDVNTFISRLPIRLKNEFDVIYKDRTDAEKFDLLFKGEFSNHIYKELSEGTGLYGFKHTPEGQAVFYKYMIPRIKALPWCIGAFIYMWNDSEICYVCGQPDCPVETGWGIVDGKGNPKPAYYAVQKAFAKDCTPYGTVKAIDNEIKENTRTFKDKLNDMKERILVAPKEKFSKLFAF